MTYGGTGLMAGLAFIVCEALESGQSAAEEWQAEARFMVRNARSLMHLLQAAGLAGRGLPPDLGAGVATDLLFEEGEVSDQTSVSFSELARLNVYASLDDFPRLAAWEGFMRGLEHSGRRSRLVIWFIW